MRKIVGRIDSASVNCRAYHSSPIEGKEFEVIGITCRIEVFDPRSEFTTRVEITLTLPQAWEVIESCEAHYLPGEIVGKHIILGREEKDGVGGTSLSYLEPFYS